MRERGGLDFVLNEDAADISGGQKQRLALAVNLTAPKRIYIFDEATGNIDAESEGIIMEVIRSLSTFAGVTVITHRLANVAAADSILYMEDGRICEQGDHASLMARGGHYVALAVLNGSLGFLCAMGVPFFGAVGIAKALGESIPLSYGAVAALCVGCGVLRGGLRYLEQYGNHYIAFRLLAVLRDRIFTKLRALCPAKLESRQKGSLLTMITADIETLEVFYAHTVSPVCIAGLVSLAVMVVTGLAASWYLSLIAAAAYLCIGILLPRFFSRRMAETGMRYRRELGDCGAYFLDSIKGIRELVLYNAGEARAAEVDRRSDAMLGRTKALKRETALSAAAAEAAVSLSVLAVLAVGILLVHGGSLSVGRMVLGVTAVFGSFGPVIAVSALPANLNQTFASGERILRLLEEQPEVEAVENGTALSYEDLEVHDLSFAYGGEAVLKGVSMTARKNEIVGIVGESGCGKSTLLKLLLRFWERSGGQIRYNGTDIDEINTESLYRNVTMVSQSTYLFDATIAENLRIAKPDATDEELMAALRMASAEELVQALPEGLSTPAGLLGGRLSMGERQRIGLARAFLSGCPLILLDEPTSNVDSINEGVILRALLKHRQGRTIILVSHRASTMAVADRVYKMKNGQMEEQAI